jgi:hypothetical protein
LIARGNTRHQLSLRIDSNHRRQQLFADFLKYARLPVDDERHHAVRCA